MFQSKTSKIFCSLSCYRNSEQFKANGTNNLAKIKAGATRKANALVTKQCLKCNGDISGTKFKMLKRKFCSSICYREYLAERFDRWIASPERIALPQNYDEFLCQEELPCLIDGCDWRGAMLSLHMNQAHGITSDEFKRATGFNLGTGVVSKPTHENLINREKTGIALNPPRTKPQGVLLVRKYRSKEHAEHQQKAIMLRNEELEENPLVKTCNGCGQLFEITKVLSHAKFCTTLCRDAYYKRIQKDQRNLKIFPLHCACCNIDFMGNNWQKERSETGYDVTCSIRCRQRVNGRSRRLNKNSVKT
jgi:hypothetical protein